MQRPLHGSPENTNTQAYCLLRREVVRGKKAIHLLSLGLLACTSSSKAPTGPGEGAPITLQSISGTCSILHFQLWSVLPPVTLLYDAVNYGYVGSLVISSQSPTSGSYQFSVTHLDSPRHISSDGSGALTLTSLDSLSFVGSQSFPQGTAFSFGAGILSLSNPAHRSFDFGSGPVTVTTTLTCQLP